MEDSILKFDLPKNQSSFIKVIGLGGGGSNAVNYMYEQGIQGVDFIVCNTDAAALDGSPVPTKIQLGKGLGAGNMPAAAQKAALEKSEEIKAHFAGNTQMVFITAGMGGGTGTGAAPVVAQLLKEIELDDEDVKQVLTVAVVTTPFSVEGRKRKQQALEGIESLRKQVDAILIINNDKLTEYGDFRMSQAFALANEILTTAVKGISEIITVRSNIQIDFRDVNTVMQNSGVALMGCGSASGENRAVEAVRQAVNSPLLNDSDITGAKNVLLYISSSPEHETTMSEFDEITHFIQKTAGHEVDVIWGAGEDVSLGENLNVTLIATGFSEKKLFEEKKVTVIGLNDDPSPVMASPALASPQMQTTERRYVLDEEPMQAVFVPQAAPSAVTASIVEPSMTILRPESLAPEEDASVEPDFYSDDALSGIRLVSPTPTATHTAAPTATDKTLSESLKDLAREKERKELLEQEAQLKNAADSPVQSDDEQWQRNTADRSRQLRELSAKIKTSEGLAELENTPAYLRRNVTLVEPTRSTDTVMPQFSLSDDGRIVSNSFLNNNVD